MIIYLMFCHYIADFWFQGEKQAKNKSKDVLVLLNHIFTYSIIMFFFASLILPIKGALIFGLLCFIFHGITDFITSKLTSIQYKEQKFYGVTGFFSIIGFDQFLHFVQIYLSYFWLVGEYGVR